MSDMGWKGLRVRHTDGRIGRIVSEYVGFCHCALMIESDDGANGGRVQLNTNGPDTGDRGWQWFCENYDGGARWLPLGEPADAEAAR